MTHKVTNDQGEVLFTGTRRECVEYAEVNSSQDQPMKVGVA